MIVGDFLNIYRPSKKKPHILNPNHNKIIVYVNPKKPNEAVLILGSFWELVVSLFLLGLILIVLTLFRDRIIAVIMNRNDLPNKQDWGGG